MRPGASKIVFEFSNGSSEVVLVILCLFGSIFDRFGIKNWSFGINLGSIFADLGHHFRHKHPGSVLSLPLPLLNLESNFKI